jgi:hypothetical protein
MNRLIVVDKVKNNRNLEVILRSFLQRINQFKKILGNAKLLLFIIIKLTDS